MRKVTRKFLTVILTIALTIGMLSSVAWAGEKVNGQSTTVYIHVSEGTYDVAINAWTGFDISGLSAHGKLDWAKQTTKVKDGLFKAEIDVWTGDDSLSLTSSSGFQIITFSDADDASGTQYKSAADYASDEQIAAFADVRTAFMNNNVVHLTVGDSNVVAISDSTDTGEAEEEETTTDSEEEEETTTDSEDEEETTTDSEDEEETTVDSEDEEETTVDSEDEEETTVDSEDEEETTVDSEDEEETTVDSEDEEETTVDSEDEEETENITIYVYNSLEWDDMYIYGWTGYDFGSWPGQEMEACESNDGWFKISFPITSDTTNIIFNNGGNGEQTVDITGVAPGTYWFSIEDAGEGEKADYDYSEEAPEDWVEEETTEIEDPDVVEEEVIELTEDEKAISKADFADLIDANSSKDVVISTPDGLTFRFAKGTMQSVDGKDSYDFGVKITKEYGKVTDMDDIDEDVFVELIDYNYSGDLPAEAEITIPVAVSYAGKTLFYSQVLDNGYKLIQKVVVSDDGTVTVKQSHCSSYVLTTINVAAEEAPAGDSSNVMLYIALALAALCASGVVATRRVKKQNA